MLNFVFGFAAALLALALAAIVVRRRWRRRRQRSGQYWMMDRALTWLEVDPDQQQPLRQALEAFLAEARQAKAELKATRSDIGEAFSAEIFAERDLEQTLSRQQALLERVRASAMELMKTAHEILRPEQRQRLATFIQSGPRYRRRHGW